MLEEYFKVKNNSECLYDHEHLSAVYGQLAQQISADYAGENPLALCVMNGGLFFTAELLKRSGMLCELDYVHASRYQGEIQGGEMNWIRFPEEKIKDRHVLLIDDILDEGITLKAIKQACTDAGAASVRAAVLCIKDHQRRIPGIEAEYVGVTVPDRYVIGCGMDYRGYLRDLDGIYAVGEGDE